MKLRIPFDDIKRAFEMASHENHHFIDKKNNKVILISEVEDDSKIKLEDMENDNFIRLEPRTPEEDFKIMQSFVYEITDFNLARKLNEALEKRKPFSNFKVLLDRHPGLRKEWFRHKDKEMHNDTINWLCIKNIELEDKNYMQEVEVKELQPDEVELPEGFKGFGPTECMRCRI